MTVNSSHVCRVEAVITGDKGIVVDAQHLSRPSIVYRNTPVLAGFSGIMAVPKVGQRVVISKDSSGFEYVEGILAGPDDPAPGLKEGEFVLQFDPTTKLTVTEGDSGYDVSLEASGDVDVKAGGDIRVGENGEKVAKQNHTHPISWSDGGGSGNSGTPNESGTETTIK